jgi:pimeloyl-ACP methyl ester carboxylesterase
MNAMNATRVAIGAVLLSLGTTSCNDQRPGNPTVNPGGPMPSSDDSTPRPFQLSVPQATLDDLQARLARTRWTDEYEGTGWGYGTNLGYMRELARYWQDGYDWRKQERALNAHPWFQVTIDGVAIRFIHARGKGPRPTPLILFHGWPDSVYRYLPVLPLLTDPAAHGASAEDAFDVVIPAVIGFPGRSGPPSPHLLKDIAERSFKLMTEKLGYTRFAAAGGDGGSPMAQLLGVHHPEAIIGLLLTDLGFHTTQARYTDLSPAEQQFLAGMQSTFDESAYAMQMGTRPQTLAFALNDSPVGMAAWIIEKFRRWSDCDGDLEKLYSKDQLLDNVMMYWLAGPSVRPFSYREEWTSGSLRPDQPVAVPTALASPPRDLVPPPPREFAARTLKDLRRFTVFERGGHFVAMEFPELFARELRAFFGQLRAATP